MERNFDLPRTDGERAIRRTIDAWRIAESAHLEKTLFAQRKRLADAERKLAVRSTLAAEDSRRIASNKITQAMARLSLINGTTPQAADSRIYPMGFAPLVVQDGARRVVRLARYHCRPAGQAADIDRRFPGLYNARRDNLGKFWRGQFGHTHGVMLVHSFFENVERNGRNEVLQFVPRPAMPMFVACLYSHWSGPDETLLSFAAITDEPPDEVRAAGHDRMIVNLRPENLDRWLTPQGRPEAEIQQILGERQQPFYEHRIAA
jgi:putative SOS response-associated peptidase YedK